MSIAVTLMAAQALMATDLQSNQFYVSGIYQGMTVSEYNSLIENGKYKSRPVKMDVYWASVDGRDIFVSFCKGSVYQAIADYRSSDWIKSIRSLEQAGFKFGAPIADSKDDEIGSSSLAFAVTVPKGYRYGVIPMVKGTTFKDQDMPSFQLMFRALGSVCT
jgi:hypothetical protein